MTYHAVGNRCAVHIPSLKLPISNSAALKILRAKGFSQIHVDTINQARELIGVAKYKRGADIRDAPNVVDCSSLMKWIYTQMGIWLPRHSIDMRDYVKESVPVNKITKGDLVFTSGFRNYFWDDPNNGVGHVGIATGNGTVIHAANSKLGVIESPLKGFTKEEKIRGVRRIIPLSENVITLLCPPDRIVEWSQTFRWIVLQNLKT
jgi:cell wall-associated NlpC family hydrolase